MEHNSKSSLDQIWRAEVSQVAARDPRLAQQLWQNRQVYYARFATYYRQLASLPRKYRRRFLRRLGATLAGAAMLLALGQTLPAHAASITVDGVVCTLAEAITSANNDNAGRTGCVSGSGADTIDLQTDVLLAAALPPITSEITLEGNGHTMSGNNAFQVLNVQTTGNLTLNDAVVTGGVSFGGGGIYNFGTATVNNSTLNGNSAYNGGGIKNFGTLIVGNSTLSGNAASNNGGGIDNSGTLTIDNSTLSDNSSVDWGAGIFNNFGNTMVMTNSALNSNSADEWGGGIFNFGGTVTVNASALSGNSVGLGFGGSGIHNNYSGTLTVNNSTINGNSAGRGSIFNAASATVNNTTISGNVASFNGGGIYNWSGTITVNNITLTGNSANNGGSIFIRTGSTVNLNRSLVSGNVALFTSPEVHNFGTVNANNYNVVGYGGSARSYGFTPGPNDLIPPGALDTVLDTALADNGGTTLTHALVTGSVAIDVAPDADCLAQPINGLDQRGYARNIDGDGSPSSNECDSGAFEFAPVGAPTPTPTVTPRPTRPAHPTATATGHVSPTPTSTPRATSQPPYPLGPTATPMLGTNEEISPAASSQDQPYDLLVRLITSTLEALGNLL